MEQNKLKVMDISKKYGSKAILNGISFESSNGISALLGSNGAGKTTLINILAGLDQNYHGSFSFNDEVVTKDNYPLEKVGFLPQTFDMFHNISGLDYLDYVYFKKGYDPTKKKTSIEKIVNQLQLESVIKQRIGKYSGGFKRRLGIAQAYLGTPSFVIIDEPTAGLDPEQREEFRSLLMLFANEKNTLISTHLTEDVELFSSNILVLSNQQIAFNGGVSDFINQAKTNIYSIDLPISELNNSNTTIKTIIERKRLDEQTITIKYFVSETQELIADSHQNHLITLENAYVYFEKNS